MVDSYFNKVSDALDRINRGDIFEIANLIHSCTGKIFVFGNGGSAATASHFAQDMNKLLNKRFICLNDNIPSILAYGNDDGFNTIFRSQLAKFLNLEDLVIGFSCSGNSENVLEAIKLANEYNVPTIGFCGFDGGRVKEIVNHNIHVLSDDMQVCEDCHMIICHTIVKMLQ